MRRSSWLVATTSSAAVLALAGPAAGATTGSKEDAARTAQRLGVQLVPKHQASKKAGAFSNPKRGVNPLIGLLPDPAKADYAYWKSAMKQQSAKRAAKRAASPKALAPEPLLVDEEEPEDLRGSNDTLASAQPIPAFGSASDRRPAARILGTIAPSADPDSVDAKPEDNGSIPLAGETGLSGSGTTTTTDATIGDGPHGSDGDGTGDFDFYAVRDAAAGQRLEVDIDTPADSELDSLVFLYDAAGNAIAANDDGEDFDSLLHYKLPADGDYFVSVAGFRCLQSDPQDSGSGSGADSEGDYAVTFGLDTLDVDTYAVNLRAGDVLGGSVSGIGNELDVNDPAGREVRGSAQQDASSVYPIDSPLPGGANAVVDHVAARDGLHYVTVVGGGQGRYDITLEVYRPGPQRAGAIPTLFLDFDGQRVNTVPFGGPGVVKLSPLRAFLARWGIPSSQYDALQDRIVATVKENVRRDFLARGTRVRVLNSRDDADPFGQPYVSRLIVGGTVSESGINTIGIAQSIDPGNFDLEETALILLDHVSDPPDPDALSDSSFNAYITPASDKLKFVGTALGNIVSHEDGPPRRELARRPVQRQAEPDGPGRELPAALRGRAGRHRRHRGRPGRRLRPGLLRS